MEHYIHLKSVINSILYSFLGLGIFTFAYYVFEKLTPGNFWKEILEEHNMALAILVGAVVLGTSMIIAASIGGG